MTDPTSKNYPNVAQSFGIVGIAILAMIVFTPVNIFLNDLIGKEASMFVYYVLSMGSVFWLVDRMRWKLTGESLYSVGMDSTKIIALVSVAVLGIQFGLVSPIISLMPMPEFMQKIFMELAGQNGIFSMLTIVIAAPILEELIFRGIILDGLLKKYSPIKSILISSALFGIVHLNPWQFVTAMAIGILSGWVYYKTHNLLLCIIIHLVNNLSAFASMQFMDAEEMMNSDLTEQYGGLMNVIIITAGALVLAGSALALLHYEFKKREINDMSNHDDSVGSGESALDDNTLS
ncbi:MAG TPA: type II CAAX endopeptidase family protein [Chryseolinea sp.]|nr:type II CAAX endopeptidase family protein [Chryseolinea sp.]HPM28978.1 type II CAAX endopeptidase family protein [Chryseolinea sp.]